MSFIAQMIERKQVIDEARSWLGTPFHMNQCVKGAGVDCGRFLIAVYSSVGLMPPFDAEYYSPQWHLHNGEEKYMATILRYGRETLKPNPGDTALFHIGRHYAHSAIVENWPRVIHVASPEIKGGVQWADALVDAFFLHGGRNFPPRFFTAWPENE